MRKIAFINHFITLHWLLEWQVAIKKINQRCSSNGNRSNDLWQQLDGSKPTSTLITLQRSNWFRFAATVGDWKKFRKCNRDWLDNSRPALLQKRHKLKSLFYLIFIVSHFTTKWVALHAIYLINFALILCNRTADTC